MIPLEQLYSGLSKTTGYEKNELDKVAGLHKYWARKPWRVLDIFIENHSKPGDTIADVFMGSGSTGLQAMLNGRNFIGVDLNPFACYLSEVTFDTTLPLEDLQADFNSLEQAVKQQIMDFYSLESGRYALWTKRVADSENLVGQTADFNFEYKTTDLVAFQAHPDKSRIKQKYPDKSFPEKFYKDRFSYKGISNVSDMFSNRNLSALAILWEAINESSYGSRKQLALILSNTLLHVSKLKSQDVRPLSVNNYWLPDDHIEENVWWRFSERFGRFRLGQAAILNEMSNRRPNKSSYKVLNKSCFDLDEIPTSSIDYILTDPPYGDAIQYSELSYIWNTWLGFEYATDQEVIVNPAQGKANSEYLSLLHNSLQEAHRILKPNKKITIAFHTRDIQLWIGLGEILRSLSLKLVSLDAFPPKGNPFTRNWAKFSPKTDMYITLEKAEVDQTQVSDVSIEFDLIAHEVIRFSIAHSLNANQTYDLFVGRVLNYVLEGNNIENLPKGRGLSPILGALDKLQAEMADIGK